MRVRSESKERLTFRRTNSNLLSGVAECCSDLLTQLQESRFASVNVAERSVIGVERYEDFTFGAGDDVRAVDQLYQKVGVERSRWEIETNIPLSSDC